MNRRTLLRASGISLALPWFETFAAKGVPKPPKRFATLYFPYGVSLPDPKGKEAEWNWFPNETGRDFTFNRSLAQLEPLRDQLTILGGLSHPQVRRIGGHDSGDTFLTGVEITPSNGFQNGPSLDQIAARKYGLGSETRFSSVTLSSDGGVGMPTRSNTLSYSLDGNPIPSLNRPATVFERLFDMSHDSIEAQRKGLTRTGSHLDFLMDEANTLHKKLGRTDQQKLDEYLTSVRQVEQDVERAAKWLEVPRPKVNADGLTLDADDNTPEELMKTMLDLIVLAFQTDSTRFATYQFGSMHGAVSISTKFSTLLGLKSNTHGLAHGMRKPGGGEQCGKWDEFQASLLKYFMEKLASIQEGDGNLLDNTLVYYGSSNSKTHSNVNYPLIVAGGKNMGYEHGQYLTYDKDVPLSNLYLTMLRRLGAEAESFVDSTGELAI
ncbi:MAG: DUF1552 domain-containing protein [Verrucomicrobiota bacterium]